MACQSRDNALDDVVATVFGNPSLDHVPGRLYGLRPAARESRPVPRVRRP